MDILLIKIEVSSRKKLINMCCILIFLSSFFLNLFLLCLDIYTLLYLFIFYFIYFWLHWVFVAATGFLSLQSFSLRWASHCGGFSCCRAQALGARASVTAVRRLCRLALRPWSVYALVVVAHELSCFSAHRIFPDQGLNPCPLHRQVDSYSLHLQELWFSFLFKC